MALYFVFKGFFGACPSSLVERKVVQVLVATQDGIDSLLLDLLFFPRVLDFTSFSTSHI